MYKLPDERTMRQQCLMGLRIVLQPDSTDWPVVLVSQRSADEHLFSVETAIQRATTICAALNHLG